MPKKFDLEVAIPKIKMLNHMPADAAEAKRLEKELNKIYKGFMVEFTKNVRQHLKCKGF